MVVAGDFQRIGVFVGRRRGQRDVAPDLLLWQGLVAPGSIGRAAIFVEVTARCRVGEVQQRERPDGTHAVRDHVQEAAEAAAGRRQRLGHRFGRRPAGPSVAGHSLGLVEGGGVEAGAPGEARWRQPCA
ncbi:hypothetical protein CEE87_13355, partial [Lactobacillus crispatus]